jgi:L-threonylcarbamoyladenylate synthase
MTDYVTRTRVYPIDPLHPNDGIIAIAADAIRDGRLVAFPTETVYGLGANAMDENAVARIFAAKQRPFTDPVIVHIAHMEQLDQVAVNLPDSARQLAAAFWAGALTMVLTRGARIPANVSAGRDTVAVRMPRHRVAHALIVAAGVPIAAPSANVFSRPSATIAAHVLDDLEGRVDVVLDGGASPIGLESTVIDLTGDTPAILRPGGVTVEQIRAVLPDVQVTARYIDAESGEAAASPGEMVRHYAPRARLLLFDGERDAVNARIMSETARLIDADQRVGILAPDEDVPVSSFRGVLVKALGSRDDLTAIGARLFAAMRALDAHNVDVILIGSLPKDGIGAAIWDRLVRAAEGQIIQV